MFSAAIKASSGILPKDPQFNYVTMLLHGDGTNGAQNNTFLDSSTNNYTITRVGNTTQGTFTPYGSNWGMYQSDANASLLNFTTSVGTSFQFTGDFTIESWVYYNSSSGDASLYVISDNTNYLALNISMSAGVYNIYLNSGTATSSFSHGISVGVWTHVAMVRSGSTVTLYTNGVSKGTITNSSTLGFSSPAINRTGGGVSGVDRYISNVRVVKSAVYTSAFTPSTTPLTAIANTSLLTCQSNRFVDNSSNAFTPTISGTPTVQRFSPFIPTTPYSSSVIGGSGYFDGSGDYLTVPTNAAFNLGTNSFTIECWYYSLGSTSYQEFISAWGTTVSNSAFLLSMNGTNLFFQVAYGGNQVSFQPTLPPNYQWNHIAMVSNGSTLSAFLNGARVGTQAFSSSINSASFTPAIGYRVAASNYAFTGYIASPRIVNGSAVYDPTLTTYTVPTAPLTAVTNTSLLANMTNAGIFDNAMMNDLETVGDAQISTSVKKYGTGSIALDGTGDWLMTPNRTNFNVGSGNFTIEAWVYTGSTSQQLIMGANRNSDGVGAWMLNLNNSGKVRFFCSYSGGTILDYNVGTGTISDSAWHHIAVTRSGSSLRIFIDGTQTGTTNTTLGTASIDNAIADYRVGSTTDGALNFNGYIDDLRVTRGFARYTSNFTPSTTAFPNN